MTDQRNATLPPAIADGGPPPEPTAPTLGEALLRAALQVDHDPSLLAAFWACVLGGEVGGARYHGHEIEAAVEELPFVELLDRHAPAARR